MASSAPVEFLLPECFNNWWAELSNIFLRGGAKKTGLHLVQSKAVKSHDLPVCPYIDTVRMSTVCFWLKLNPIFLLFQLKVTFFMFSFNLTAT